MTFSTGHQAPPHACGLKCPFAFSSGITGISMRTTSCSSVRWQWPAVEGAPLLSWSLRICGVSAPGAQCSQEQRVGACLGSGAGREKSFGCRWVAMPATRCQTGRTPCRFTSAPCRVRMRCLTSRRRPRGETLRPLLGVRPSHVATRPCGWHQVSQVVGSPLVARNTDTSKWLSLPPSMGSPLGRGWCGAGVGWGCGSGCGCGCGCGCKVAWAMGSF